MIVSLGTRPTSRLRTANQGRRKASPSKEAFFQNAVTLNFDRETTSRPQVIHMAAGAGKTHHVSRLLHLHGSIKIVEAEVKKPQSGYQLLLLPKDRRQSEIPGSGRRESVVASDSVNEVGDHTTTEGNGGDGDDGGGGDDGEGGDGDDDPPAATLIAAVIVVVIIFAVAQLEPDRLVSPAGGFGGLVTYLGRRPRHTRLATALRHAALNALCGSLIAVPISTLLSAWKPGVLAFFAGASWRSILFFCVRKFHAILRALS